ncbi:MAG TPA: AMP-binding protein [Gemmatimonadales bacterium]|nr:AMP-binding protein [Gemmatimonadales bacterium]
MHIPLEQLVLLGYLDSLFVEGSKREVAPRRELPATLNQLYMQAMREHVREHALLAPTATGWSGMPDWRLDRQVIRVALYLRERLGLEPGQRVVLLSELRPEWLVADLAALGSGAVSVAIDPRLERDELAAALEDAAPRITFVSAAAQRALERLDGRAPPQGQVIALDAAVAHDGAMTLQTLLDMGGILDTPERAQAHRAEARAVGPDRPALRHWRTRARGAGDWIELSQGEAIERLRTGWLREWAQAGDVAYVADPSVALMSRLALYAFLGDGYTTTAIAGGGGTLDEVAALRPAAIVAPPALLAAAVEAARARAGVRRNGASQAVAGQAVQGGGGWLQRVAALAPRTSARRQGGAIQSALGGRARRIGSGEPLDAALGEQLGIAAMVMPTV